MLEATFWGFVGGAALLIGAAAGIWLPASKGFIGLVMGFGTGVLISALAFDLTGDAYDSAGAVAVVVGLSGGALTYFVGDWVIDRHGGHRRKSPNGPQEDAAASALVLGALLDGIPESVAIGVSLIDGGAVSVAVVAAVFLSNIPEGLSASAGLKVSGRSNARILGLWTAVTLVSAASAGLGYLLLGNTDPVVVATTQAFAAGAILTMLSDTMVPEAVEHAGAMVGLVTAAGFIASFLLSQA